MKDFEAQVSLRIKTEKKIAYMFDFQNVQKDNIVNLNKELRSMKEDKDFV